MSQKRMAATVLAHRDGQKTEHWKLLIPILPLLRAAVKMAAVTLGIYILAAVAALVLLAMQAGKQPPAAKNENLAGQRP